MVDEERGEPDKCNIIGNAIALDDGHLNWPFWTCTDDFVKACSEDRCTEWRNGSAISPMEQHFSVDDVPVDSIVTLDATHWTGHKPLMEDLGNATGVHPTSNKKTPAQKRLSKQLENICERYSNKIMVLVITNSCHNQNAICRFLQILLEVLCTAVECEIYCVLPENGPCEIKGSSIHDPEVLVSVRVKKIMEERYWVSEEKETESDKGEEGEEGEGEEEVRCPTKEEGQ